MLPSGAKTDSGPYMRHIRSSVAAGTSGWGAKGKLDLDAIRKLAKAG